MPNTIPAQDTYREERKKGGKKERKTDIVTVTQALEQPHTTPTRCTSKSAVNRAATDTRHITCVGSKEGRKKIQLSNPEPRGNGGVEMKGRGKPCDGLGVGLARLGALPTKTPPKNISIFLPKPRSHKL
jgi:hypothetical protein